MLSPLKPAMAASCTVQITEGAAAFLKGVINGRGLSVGCACLCLSASSEHGRVEYHMQLTESPSSGLRVTSQGLELAIDPNSASLLDGLEIGFVGGVLSMANPNVTGAESDRKTA